MERLRKALVVSVMSITVISMSMLAVPFQVGATASAGDLIKMSGLSSVYYLGADGKRYVFPNEQTYFSWYSDFSGVVTIPQSELESYPLGANVTIRPGTKLVKITTDPKVYAVEPDGSLKWVPSETVASTLFGANWSKRVVDVPDAFFTNYTVASGQLTASAYPTGSLVKWSGSADVYYIDSNGEAQKVATEAAFTANRFKWSDVISAPDSVVKPALGTEITGAVATITDTSSGAGGTAGAGTGLTVSLASDTPAANSIPSRATNVPVLKINLTASNDGAVTVNSLAFHKTGVGATTDIQGLYVYEGNSRLTSARTVNSSTALATFSNMAFAVPAGTTKTLTLVADIADNKTGNHAFELQTASAVATNGASVSGSFPVAGNTMSLKATVAGTVTVTKGANPSNVIAGSTGKELSSFTLAAGTEDGKLEKIALYYAGGISKSDISNLKLYYNNDTAVDPIATVASIDSQDLAVFTLATPFTLPKGESKKFYVYGDVSSSAKATATATAKDGIVFYLDNYSDLRAIGQTYGFGMAVDNATYSYSGAAGSGTFDGSSTGTKYTEAEIEGGDVVVATQGPAATNVQRGGKDIDFLNFSLTCGQEADIKNLQIEFHSVGTDLDGSDTTVSSNYITDVKITDTGSNVVIAGPVDISSFTDIGSSAGVGYAWTNPGIICSATKNYKITADLSTSLDSGSQLYIVIGDKVDGNTFTSTAIKSTGTSQYLTSIVPSTYTSGNYMTLKANSLTTSRSSVVPLAQNITKGATGVSTAAIVFDATASGGDVKVTSIKLTGYVDGYTGTAALSSYSTSTLKITDLVTAVKIYDYNNGTPIQTGLTATSKSFDTSGNATFTGLGWTIPAGTSKTLLIKVDTSNSAALSVGTANADRFAIDIADVSADIGAQDKDGTTVTPSGSDNPNAANSTTGAQVTIRSAGTVTMQDGTKPTTTLVEAGATNVPYHQMKFAGTYESFTVSKLRVSISANAENFSRIGLKYKKVDGTYETVWASVDATNSRADFSGLKFYVPKDDYAFIDVLADLKTVDNGATPGVGPTLDILGATGNFEANGTGDSNTQLTAASTDNSSTGNAMYLVKSKPVFTVESLPTTVLADGSKTLLKFTVSSGVGTVSFKKILFNVTASDNSSSGTLNLASFRLYNAADTSTALNATFWDTKLSASAYSTSLLNGASAVYGDSANSRNAMVIFDNVSHAASTWGDSAGEEIVNAGSPKTYLLQATVSGSAQYDSVTSKVASEGLATTFTRGIVTDDAGDLDVIVSNGSDCSMMWSDYSSTTNHSAGTSSPSSDWYSGLYISSLETNTATLSR